jgi:RNA polymerase-binding protein DksA
MALTPSQVEHYRQILVARRDELASETVRAESGVGDQDELGRMDYGDRANADTAKEDLLQEAGRDSEELQQIEAALRHIAAGTYGICEECGREIPVARLDAVPWALLCVRDQEIADGQRRAAGTMSGGAPSRVVQ